MKRKIAITLSALIVLSSTSISFGKNFPDSNNHWANKEIDNITNIGLMSGYPDGNFRPNSNITRAEILKLTSNIIETYTKLEKIATNKPIDINNSMYSWITNDDVSNVIGNKIMGGYEDGLFRPSNNITRAETVITILRTIKAVNPDYELKQTKNITFTDTSNHWAKDSIKLLAESGIINGYSDGSFKPNNEITRAEATVILNNIESILGKTDPGPEPPPPPGPTPPPPGPTPPPIIDDKSVEVKLEVPEINSPLDGIDMRAKKKIETKTGKKLIYIDKTTMIDKYGIGILENPFLQNATNNWVDYKDVYLARRPYPAFTWNNVKLVTQGSDKKIYTVPKTEIDIEATKKHFKDGELQLGNSALVFPTEKEALDWWSSHSESSELWSKAGFSSVWIVYTSWINKEGKEITGVSLDFHNRYDERPDDLVPLMKVNPDTWYFATNIYNKKDGWVAGLDKECTANERLGNGRYTLYERDYSPKHRGLLFDMKNGIIH